MRRYWKQVEYLCVNNQTDEAKAIMERYDEDRDIPWILMLYVVFLIFTSYMWYSRFAYVAGEMIKVDIGLSIALILFIVLSIRETVRYYKFISYLRSKNISNFL